MLAERDGQEFMRLKLRLAFGGTSWTVQS